MDVIVVVVVVIVIIIIIIIIEIKHLYKQFGDGSSSLPPHLQKFKDVPMQRIPPETKQPEHEADHSFPSRANTEIAWRIPSTPPEHLNGVIIRQNGTPL